MTLWNPATVASSKKKNCDPQGMLSQSYILYSSKYYFCLSF